MTKYKNLPLILIFSDNIDLLPYDKENKCFKKSGTLYNLIEIICYCKETEKEIYLPILTEIKNKLSK